MTYTYNIMVKYNYTQGIFCLCNAINLEFLLSNFFTTRCFSMKILLTRILLQSYRF